MTKLQTFTTFTQCTPVGESGPLCPPGWESVGYTQPGSCTLGNVPGDGPRDAWKMYGYNRVCKRKVPTSGDLSVDCCSDLFGIRGSVECRSAGFEPYSWTCNNVMTKRCNTRVQDDPYSPEWNGMPKGQDPKIWDGCSGRIRGPPDQPQAGCLDKFCVNYLKRAPPNNFFHQHDFTDARYHFPRHSYVTPGFDGTWGYQPMRTPYKPYHEWENKNNNNYCRQFPNQCWSINEL